MCFTKQKNVIKINYHTFFYKINKYQKYKNESFDSEHLHYIDNQ